MKANEFVKKFGWGKAKKGLKLCVDSGKELHVIGGGRVDITDLKRLVESHELVSQFDDIGQAKSYLPEIDNDIPWSVKGGDLRFFHCQLEQAILDVESCQ